MKPWFPLYFTLPIGIAMIALSISLSRLPRDPNHIRLPHSNGEISKIEYQGHSYVIWAINLGGGIVHDPDCLCNKIKEEMK